MGVFLLCFLILLRDIYYILYLYKNIIFKKERKEKKERKKERKERKKEKKSKEKVVTTKFKINK